MDLPIPFFTMNESPNFDAVKLVQAHQERQLTELVPLRLHRWAFWRRPVYVNLSWLQRQAELAQQAAEIELSRVALTSELNQFQREAATRRSAERGLRKWMKAVDWASSPTTRSRRSYIPGIGLELSLIVTFVALSVAHLMV